MRKKIYGILILLICIFGLTACSGELYYVKKGLNVTVTFDLQGGEFQEEKSEMTYKVKENSYLANPLDNYTVRLNTKKAGYDFAGWYKDSECSIPWVFENEIVTEDVTIYAKWDFIIMYNFVFIYINDEGQEVPFYTGGSRTPGSTVSVFETTVKRARDNYTLLGLYQDAELQIPWDYDFVHPGGEQLNVKVYTKWVEGDFALVYTAKDLSSALSSKKSIYLMNDIIGEIDEDGNPTSIWTRPEYYGGGPTTPKIIKGNNFTIKNFKVKYTELASITYVGLFGTLTNVIIQDVTFENILFDITINRNGRFYIASIAGALGPNSINKFENITFDGKIVINNQKDGIIQIEESEIACLINSNAAIEQENVFINTILIDKR